MTGNHSREQTEVVLHDRFGHRLRGHVDHAQSRLTQQQEQEQAAQAEEPGAAELLRDVPLQLTVELARRMASFLYRAQHDPELRFDESGPAVDLGASDVHLKLGRGSLGYTMRR